MTGNVFCELIVDGFHISPPVVKMTERLTSPDRLTLITDSMEATGCPDGEYSIAGMPVTVKDGKALTHDGAIAGSTLSLFDGVKNLMHFADISFGKALYYATATPQRRSAFSAGSARSRSANMRIFFWSIPTRLICARSGSAESGDSRSSDGIRPRDLPAK